MDNSATDGQQAGQPLGLGLSELLGPLPEGREYIAGMNRHFAKVCGTVTAYSAEDMRAYAQREVAAERERCAAWVDARRDAFCEEHGSIDPDTGTLEFGRGAHAEAKSDYVGELEEIAAGLRALRA